jgi:large subunit ribosomal protein L19
MYNPTIVSIEVLRLEKRLDDNLQYLQDCPAEYSTIPFDMQSTKLLPGMKVPVNTVKVPLRPKPWRHRWERKSLKGVTYPAEMKQFEYQQYKDSYSELRPHERWDLMKHYRESVHDHDHKAIVDELKRFESGVSDQREVVTSSKKLTKTRRIPGETKNQK